MWDIVTNASSHYYSQYTQEYAAAGKVVLTPDNSRFLHLDMVQIYDTSTYARETFGSDMMNPTANSLNSIPSNPIFIVYDKSTENIFYENPEYDYPSTVKLSSFLSISHISFQALRSLILPYLRTSIP